MKNILLIFLILISFKNYSQNFKEKELKKIESFGINLTEFDFNEKKVINDWNLILKKEKKRKKNKTIGIVLTSLSALTTAFGIYVISNTRNEGEGESFGDVIGGMAIAVGVIEGGISIPLYISSSKRRKERNKLIKLYNEKYSD